TELGAGVDVSADHPIARLSVGALRGGREPLLPEEVDCALEVLPRSGEPLLAVHHSGSGLVPELAHFLRRRGHDFSTPPAVPPNGRAAAPGWRGPGHRLTGASDRPENARDAGSLGRGWVAPPGGPPRDRRRSPPLRPSPPLAPPPRSPWRTRRAPPRPHPQ